LYFSGVAIMLLLQLFLTCIHMVPAITHYGMYAFIAIGHTPYVWSSCDSEWTVTKSAQCVTTEPHRWVNDGHPYWTGNKQTSYTWSL